MFYIKKFYKYFYYSLFVKKYNYKSLPKKNILQKNKNYINILFNKQNIYII